MKNLFSCLPLKIGIPFCSICLFPFALCAQTAWLRHFSPTDILHSVQTLPDGYALLAYDSNGVYRLRTDLFGNPLDTVQLGPLPADLVPTADGGFFKCFLENPNLRLEKRDAAGNMLWEQVLTDTSSQAWPVLAALPDGGCYVVSVSSYIYPSTYAHTIVQRIAADGTRLWMRYVDPLNAWSYNSSRSIRDAVALPDSSCLVLSDDNWDGWHGSCRLFQIKPDGTTGYACNFPAPWAYASNSSLHTARPTADGKVLAAGFKGISSAGGHPASTVWGFVASLEAAGATTIVEETLYPPTTSQIFTLYAPYPGALAPMPEGDMLVIVQKNQDAQLWRGSWNLQDTAWQQKLTPEGGFYSNKIKRPNRLIHATPDHGAVLGGVDSAGIFLRKVGFFGDDSTLSFHSISGQVLLDTDFDCTLPGPYAPAPGVAVRLSCPDFPSLTRILYTDSLGQIASAVPTGTWRAEVADSLAAIYGKSCQAEAVVTVSDTAAATPFALSVVRYAARLSGRIWYDGNFNCLTDENSAGFGSGDQLVLRHQGTEYLAPVGDQGFFDLAVDTGQYELRIRYRQPGPFKGYYCLPTTAFLPDHQSADTVTLVWSAWQNSQVRIKVRRDANYNCLHDLSDANWKGMDMLLTDTLSGQQQAIVSELSGWAEWPVRGPGALRIAIAASFPDSLVCTTGLPHYAVFAPDADNQVFTDTLLTRYPRWHDSLYVCPGTSIWGVTVDTDVVIVQPAIFQYEYQVPFYHHVFTLPTAVTHLYQALPPGQTDTLETLIFPAANGCDSTVVIHYVTGIEEPVAATGLRIMPNPARDEALVVLPVDTRGWLTLSDPTGRALRLVEIPAGQIAFTLPLHGLPAGVFWLQVRRRDGAIARGKLVVY